MEYLKLNRIVILLILLLPSCKNTEHDIGKTLTISGKIEKYDDVRSIVLSKYNLLAKFQSGHLDMEFNEYGKLS